MDRQSVIDALRAHQTELQQRGFKHISLFGSVARGDARADSDIDLLVDLDDTKDIGFGYVGTIDRISAILGSEIDIVTLPIRKDYLRQEIERDRVDAF